MVYKDFEPELVWHQNLCPNLIFPLYELKEILFFNFIVMEEFYLLSLKEVTSIKITMDHEVETFMR